MLESRREIEEAGQAFEDLARQTDAILKVAAGIIGCVEDLRVSSILAKVRSLGIEVRSFIQDRLQATNGILELAASEAKLLGRLSQLTRGQRSIARETQVLSVLTNIEVARLAHLGAGFKYLAQQLDCFSQSVAQGAKDLTCHTEERKTSIEQTRCMLAARLPCMDRELMQIEADLAEALSAVDSGLTRLSGTPAQFRSCVEEIAGKIAGVVAAIQAHDITRQQVEHVDEALRMIAVRLDTADGSAIEGPRIAAGLVIQAYQLRNIRETMSSWVAQIRACIDGILRVSCSEVLGIGPLVLDQERGLSSELARIGALEQECQQDSAEAQATFANLSTLMQLVGEHVDRSRSVRGELRLLTFNSMIEANRLGAKAAAILEISQSIKRASDTWGGITDRSAQAKEEILELMKRAESMMKVYAQTGCGRLAGAQAETRSALDSLRAAAEFAAEQAVAIEGAIGALQAKIAVAGAAGSRLDALIAHVDAALSRIEALQRQIDEQYPEGVGPFDHAEMEALYSVSYTTEMEREVLHAALSGGPLPAAQRNLTGNDVELF